MSLSGSQSHEDALHDSWVDLEGQKTSGALDSSTTSILNTDKERILLDVQVECERRQTGSSPQILKTSGYPKGASEDDSNSTDCVTIQSDESDSRVSTEWVWDWSSRPENLPPREFVFHHPKKSSSLSMRKTEVMKRGLFSSDVFLILLPSLLASHALTLGVGIYIGKRLASSSTSTL